LTRAAWLRLFLPELLPDLSRVIYLDVDMIVRDSLEELWCLDLGEHWFAAVTDIPKKVGGVLAYQRVGLAEASLYFNSGLLLIDLGRFRRERVAERVLRFAAEHPDKVALADQDPLNAVLHTHRYALPLRWNVMAPMHEGGIDHGFPFTQAEADEAMRRPAVIHYSGLWKPWHYRSKHPLRRLYTEYRKQSPWPDWQTEGQTLKHKVLRLFPESTAWWMAYYWWKVRRGLRLAE
jgi:lipopolysaccharide biosynthesis glycosyltransferase